MDTKPLIDAIVRQTTLLIAALSTASGIRAPLAHVADQVFLDLAKEIESHGVGRKVVADMFGLALRTYQKKVQRLSESVSERNRSLWEAVYQRILDAEPIERKDVERSFPRDEPDDIAAVLHDLVSSGLVQADRRSVTAIYRAAPVRQTAGATSPRDREALALLSWAAIYRKDAVTLRDLARVLGATPEEVEAVVGKLLIEGRVRWNRERSALQADVLLLPVGSEQGWEAAVFHHFSAVAAAIASKVALGPASRANDRIGGATLSFDIHEGHPYELEVYALLGRIRRDVNELWEKVAARNRSHPIEEAEKVKVTFYFGQNVEQVVDERARPGERSHG